MLPEVPSSADSDFAMRRSGFTLIEILVVIALIAVITTAFLAAFGAFSAGDQLKDAAEGVKSLVERGRSTALAKNSRFEMLVDFERNEIHSWERRQVTFFGFESNQGANGHYIDGPLGLKPYYYEENLLSGAALALWDRAHAFTIPEHPEFYAEGNNDGLALSFDFLPYTLAGNNLPLIRQQNWSIAIREVVNGVAHLEAQIQGIPFRSEVPCAMGEWVRVEIVISTINPRFYVAGVPADFRFGGGVNVDSITSTLADLRSAPPSIGRGAIQIGGTGVKPFLLDNLRIEKLAPLRVLELYSQWSVVASPPGADPSAALNLQLFTGKTKVLTGIVQPLDAATTSANLTAPMRAAMILFDERGQLDTSIHRGAVTLTLLRASDDNQGIRRVALEISSLGAVEELADLRQERLKMPETPIKEDPYRSRVKPKNSGATK